MACAHPQSLSKISKSFVPFNLYDCYVPCGMCLNCRVDKQNELTHRCEYEFIQFKCGAFVTCTYDDYHLTKDLIFNRSTNKLEATLNKSDSVKFLKRLRQNVKRSLPDCILSNHKFKFLVVGEYGGDGQIFDRPHFHFLFFGLDFAYCKKIFEKSWNGNGEIKVLPILNGGITYCLKYLDKQLFGKLAKQKYDDNGLTRPFQNHSIGLGSQLFYDQIEYAKTHHNCYRWKAKDVPMPMYYRNRYLLPKNNRLEVHANQIKNIKMLYNVEIHNLYDLHDFQFKKSQCREENMNHWLHAKGFPRFEYDSLILRKKSDEYRDSLLSYCYS